MPAGGSIGPGTSSQQTRYLIERLLVGQTGEVGAARRAAITHEPAWCYIRPTQQQKGSVVQIAAT